LPAAVSVPKPHRLRDPKAIQAARKDYCELCHRPAYGEPHHLWSRGCGGPDHRFNLIQLCQQHHRDAQDALIPREFLINIVSRREGVDVETVIQKINQLRGRG